MFIFEAEAIINKKKSFKLQRKSKADAISMVASSPKVRLLQQKKKSKAWMTLQYVPHVIK